MPTSPSWVLHDVDSFERFSAAWDRVNDASSGLPFMSSMFIRNLLKVFRSGREVLAVLGLPGEEQALTIVTNRRTGVWETYQPSQLPIGAWVMRPDVDYAQAMNALLGRLPRIPLLLAVTQQDPVVHGRPAHSATLRTVDYIDTGWVEVAGTWDAYWKSRSKSLQQNMRTQRSKLASQGIKPSLEVITSAAGVASAVEDFGKLEIAGWKGDRGTAVRPDSDQGRFYRQMLEDFCNSGKARIYRYRFDDKVVAVDLCIESQTVQVLLKTTYDESIKSLSPSSLMRQEAYQQIFEEGRLKRLEYYGRFMEWTKRWTDCKRTLYHINAYRWGILPTAAARLAGLRGALQRRTATPA